MAKKKTKRKYLPATLAATGIGATLLIYFGSQFIAAPASTAIRVFDGDTFETQEKQYIRVSGIDSPETGRCGSEEAKKEMEKLVLGKKLYIKVYFHQGARLNGAVYNEQGNIAIPMLASGWAVLNDRDNLDIPELALAMSKAKEKHVGLFSEMCTQSINKEKPNCTIKGNIRDNVKTYHLTSCKSYKTTDVQLYNGDQWFCSEKEAQKAGFRKASQCP